MTDAKQKLERAVDLHRRGQLGEAETLYLGLLENEPDNANALHLLGALKLAQDEPEAARTFIARAIEHKPDATAFKINLATALKRLGRTGEAVDLLSACLRTEPGNADASNNLGNLCAECGRVDEAIGHYHDALASRPDNLDTLYNLGNALVNRGRPEQALSFLRKVVDRNGDHAPARLALGVALASTGKHVEAIRELKSLVAKQPDHALGWVQLGRALHGVALHSDAIEAFERAICLDPNLPEAQVFLALAFSDMKRYAEAIRHFERAIALRPNYGDALLALGNVYRDMGLITVAREKYRQALVAVPGFAAAFNNLAITYTAERRYEEARQYYEAAVGHEPGFAGGYSNLGFAMFEMGNFREAERLFRRSLEIQADCVDAQWNMALFELLQGDFANGWKRYETRWQKQDMRTPIYAERNRLADLVPRWTGKEMIAGKRILVFVEQGFGDTIQFCRYLPMLSALGAEITLWTGDELVELLGSLRAKVAIVTMVTDSRAFDYHCPLLSLPLAFGTGSDNIPADVPYLRAPERLASVWAAEAAAVASFGEAKIGIAWAGRPEYGGDAKRSIALASFEKIFSQAGIRWFSLQKGPASAQISESKAAIVDFTPRLNNFSDTAALIESLDAVICVDTAVAHLSGALGKPTWILLPYVPDFRWQLGRTDSPWYPSAALFRQPAVGDWPSAFDALEKHVRRWMEARTRAGLFRTPPGTSSSP